MNKKIVDIIKVEVLGPYKLYLYFDDGGQGEVDIAELIPFEGVFKPLNDKNFFKEVSVNPDIGTICWSNGADLSPVYLKKHIR